MTTWALLAPGPSASAEQAMRVRHLPVVAVGCAYQLAPWAAIIASSDAAWWRSYPDAKELPAAKFAMAQVPGVGRVRIPEFGQAVNSGVLGLECAKRAGATRIVLLGVDMHGSHYFGPYTNGLGNTNTAQRRQHFAQYERWARANRGIEVLNCTPKSALQCFPMARLHDVISGHVQMGDAGLPGDVQERACQHPSPDDASALPGADSVHVLHG